MCHVFFLSESLINNNNCSSCESEELSVGLNSPVEDSPIVLSPHIPDSVILLSEAVFLRLKAVFLRLELSRGTTIAAKFGQVVVDLKLEVK